MEKKNKNTGTILGIVMLLIMIIGVTYAAFQYTKKGTKENELTTGTVSFKYNETGNGVTLTNAYPMSDGEGKKMNKGNGEGDNGYFDFDVTSTMGNNMEIQYYVYAVDITGEEENKLDPKYVKVYLTDQSSPENPYGGYEGEVPVYSELDNVNAVDENKEPVEGKLLYQNKFTESGEHLYRLRLWVSDEYETTEVSKIFKMRVDVNTEASITSGDTDKPTCEVVSAEPKKASRDEDIKMNIKCSDNFGTVTSNMKSNNIHVKQNGSEVQPTKKELTEGIALAEVTGRHGVQHTLTLNGFENEGDITITIDSGVLQDKKGNTNDEIELTPGVSISKRVKVTLLNGGGVESFGEQDTLTCDIKEGDTCNVILPTITPNEGYTGSFWSEEETAHEGKTGNIEVSSDTTYYAIGYKEVTSTYTIGEGVDSIGKESDSCTYYGKETSCKVELPTIKSKEGYDAGKWGLTSGGPAELVAGQQVDVSDSETAKYTATSKDSTPPECSLSKITTPSQPLGTEGEFTVEQNDEEATVVIKCTDTSGGITKDLALDQVSINIAEDDATAEITEEGSGTDTTDGREHTYKMKNFSAPGLVVVKVAEGAVTDATGNQNIPTDITTGLTVKAAGKNGIPTNDSSAEYNEETKHNMFEFTHENTNQKDASTEYRYIGNDPYNYVNLLGRDDGKSDANLWRIIGVFDDPSTGEGRKGEYKIKLILDKKLNNTNYAWDNNGQYGSNNWARPSALKTALNNLFWNSTSGSCPLCSGSYPNYCSPGTTSCNFASYDIKSVQDKIEEMKWFLGGWNTYVSAEEFYKNERGTTTPSGASNSTTGYVGLPYVSDYAYTFAKGIDATCFNTPNSCNSGKSSSSWMFNSDNWWTLTPHSGTAYVVFSVSSLGTIDVPPAYYPYAGVRPVVYLKSNYHITGGHGTKDEPYTVG